MSGCESAYCHCHVLLGEILTLDRDVALRGAALGVARGNQLVEVREETRSLALVRVVNAQSCHKRKKYANTLCGRLRDPL